MKLSQTNLTFYTLAHTCVDAICAITVMQNSHLFLPTLMFWFVIGYDLLAFATQPFIGFLIDKCHRKKELILFSFILLMIGFMAPFHQWIRILLVGIGNSLFHVGAGAKVLESSHHKMWPLGVFVSTGTIGLTLGSQYPNNFYIQALFIGLLALIFCGLLLTDSNKSSSHIELFTPIKIPLWVPTSLLFCISIRSFMGFAKPIPFTDITFLPVIISIFVFGGKFIGGFLCDRFSISLVVIVSVPVACLCYFLGPLNYLVWGMAQFLVNLSMPITLFLLYRCMPNRAGFSFGLAAAFLIPGLFIALLPISVPDFIFGIIFAINLTLLLAANKIIQSTIKQE